MSYIQLNIGGQPRGLKFNKLALLEMQSKTDWARIDKTSAYALIWGGMVGNAYVKQTEIDFTFEQVCDWVDEMAEADILMADACFQTTLIYKQLLQKAEVIASESIENIKKKLPKANVKKKRLSTAT